MHIDEIFPPFCVRENYDRCKKIVYDLREYAADEFEHELLPIYEYALYHLFNWWLDVIEEEVLTLTVTSELKTDDEKYIAKNINDIEEYTVFMFMDYDFLDVGYLTKIHKNNPSILKGFFHIDLDDYVDLMPPDIRMEYIDSSKKYTIQPDNNEELIVKLIYYAIKSREHNPKRLQKTSETELSDDIADFLRAKLDEKNLIIHREFPAGFSKKTLGELDFCTLPQEIIYIKLLLLERTKNGRILEDNSNSYLVT